MSVLKYLNVRVLSWIFVMQISKCDHLRAMCPIRVRAPIGLRAHRKLMCSGRDCERHAPLSKHLYITQTESNRSKQAAAQKAVAVAGSRCCRPASHVLSHVEGLPESTQFLSFCGTSPDRRSCCRICRPWCPSACPLRSRASCRICISWSTAHVRTPRRDDRAAIHMTPPNHPT